MGVLGDSSVPSEAGTRWHQWSRKEQVTPGKLRDPEEATV